MAFYAPGQQPADNPGYIPPQNGGGYPPPQQGYPQPPPPQGGAYPPPVPMGGAAQMAPGIQWMPIPTSIPNCPPGLEYVSQVDQILVHQVVELLEAFTGWETQNRYAIKNSMGQQVYYAFEESDVCMRQCCGANRGFVMHIVDNMNREVIKVNREFKCCASGCSWFACCGGCSHEVAVEAPVGQIVGYVRQICSAWVPTFEILDASREKVLGISGPICICQGAWCFDHTFEVKSRDNSVQVGKISKQFSGYAKEMFTDADNFGVSFPMDLDVRVKAVMIGAVFLIDSMFFENSGNEK